MGGGENISPPKKKRATLQNSRGCPPKESSPNGEYIRELIHKIARFNKRGGQNNTPSPPPFCGHG